MTSEERTTALRLGRVAAELKMRRQRALVEDRLSQAGLDVWAPRVIRSGGCY